MKIRIRHNAHSSTSTPDHAYAINAMRPSNRTLWNARTTHIGVLDLLLMDTPPDALSLIPGQNHLSSFRKTVNTCVTARTGCTLAVVRLGHLQETNQDAGNDVHSRRDTQSYPMELHTCVKCVCGDSESVFVQVSTPDHLPTTTEDVLGHWLLTWNITAGMRISHVCSPETLSTSRVSIQPQ